MAVVGIPGWIGTSAVAETGQRWMTAASRELRLGNPSWMSQFAGRSREIIHTLGADHNFNGQWFRDRCFEAGGAPIVFNITGNLVSYTKDVPLFFMYGDTPNEYVTLNIHGGVHMWGRGGNGTVNGNPGTNGGDVIQNDIGGRLRIWNYGVIASGGGGGGAVSLQNSWAPNATAGGGGGRPFGIGGGGVNWPGGNASYDAPGGAGYTSQFGGGNGGDAGGRGGEDGIITYLDLAVVLLVERYSEVSNVGRYRRYLWLLVIIRKY
ncbi:long tail fiber assembly catalyst [Escherichia phage Bp7]|uniref:Receptor-recognizing protein gp38 n=1 Tax=Escherichia phage Bp7 TaxID=1052121 RepID=G3MUK4_9CAUD|nr:tail fiber protein; host specificity [Escherichia phage Bp7]AEN93874.1 long tail fiber assembly catalyst [Escherichia phage Bp7]